MKPPSVLLVDDDAAFRHVMSSELSRLGYQVTTASSGEDAIRQVVASEPEVVMLDLRLPGMSGLEALKAINANAPATEVIMLTGHGSIDTAIESIRIGAFDYVVKPCPLGRARYSHSSGVGAARVAAKGKSARTRTNPARSRQLLPRRKPRNSDTWSASSIALLPAMPPSSSWVKPERARNAWPS